MRNRDPEEIKKTLDNFDSKYDKTLKELLLNESKDKETANNIATTALRKYIEDISQAFWYRYTQTALKLCKLGRLFDETLSIIYNDRLQRIPLASLTTTVTTPDDMENFFKVVQRLKPDISKLLDLPNTSSQCSKALLRGDKYTLDRHKGLVKTLTLNQLLKDQSTYQSLLKKLETNI